MSSSTALSLLATLSAITVKRLAVEWGVNQIFMKTKERIAFWKTEFYNATSGLNILLITKQSNNDFLKKR